MDETRAKTFSTTDIVIFVIMLMISITIGLFVAFRNRNKNNTLNYFLGNRQLKTLPVAISFVVTFQSSIMMLGFPAEAYAYGMQYSVQVIGVIIGYSLAVILVVPIFHPLKMTSAYHYYQLRYGENSVRYLAVICGIVYYLIYMGIVLYGTALALQSAAGIPLWLTVIVFTSVTVFYTSIGGIQAVIWTDVFQCVVMVIGILAVLISSTIKTGGPKDVLELSRSRINFFNFNPDPTVRHSFWSLLIGGIGPFFYCTISQSGIQRINSTPSVKVAKRMVLIVGPVYGFNWVLSMFQGVSLFAYFSKKGCDPLASGDIANVNQVVPYSMMELFRSMPGFPGLVISALAAGALSTISSGLGSLAAITCEDIVKQLKPNITDRTAVNISKVSVVVFGIIATGLSFLLMHTTGPLGQLLTTLVSSVDGPLVGLYLLSIFFHRAHPKALVFATLLGIGFVLFIGSGQIFSDSVAANPYLPLGPTTNCSTIQDTVKQGADYFYFENYRNETNVPSAINSSIGPPIEEYSSRTDGTMMQQLFSISYMYFSLIGTIVTIASGVALSLLIHLIRPDSIPEIDKDLILSISNISPCLNKRRKHDKHKGKTEHLADKISDEELQVMTETNVNNIVEL